MTHVNYANSVRNPDPRAYRLLIDKNLAPSLALALSADPACCRAVLGDLMPGSIVPRSSGARRRA